MNNTTGLIPEIGTAQLIAESRERFLEDLVVETANLISITSPADFLEFIGTDPQEVYVQKTLNRLNPGVVLSSDFYFSTPESVFGFTRSDGFFKSKEKRLDEITIPNLMECRAEQLAEEYKTADGKRGNPIPVFFFDSASKRSFDAAISLYGFNVQKKIGIFVPNYGQVGLYLYQAPK